MQPTKRNESQRIETSDSNRKWEEQEEEDEVCLCGMDDEDEDEDWGWSEMCQSQGNKSLSMGDGQWSADEWVPTSCSSYLKRIHERDSGRVLDGLCKSVG